MTNCRLDWLSKNGQITFKMDSVAGETIIYTCDALKRRVTVSGNQNWEETCTYDGFGNLTQIQPSEPTLRATSTQPQPA